MKEKKSSKLFEWQKRCKSGSEKCTKCGETRWLTVDHIIPVSILECFSLDRIDVIYNYEDNFEILCRYCNSEKGCRLEPRNPKTYTILRKLLDQSEKEALSI